MGGCLPAVVVVWGSITVAGLLLLILLCASQTARTNKKGKNVENFRFADATDTAYEYGVTHRMVAHNVALRNHGPSKDPLYLQTNQSQTSVELGAVEDEAQATLWNVYQSSSSPNFCIAVASDPQRALQTTNDGTSVHIEPTLGHRRFCWKIAAHVESRFSLQITVQNTLGNGGYLGPSWSTAGRNTQGAISCGATTVTDWQRWDLLDVHKPPHCAKDPHTDCHWSMDTLPCTGTPA